MSLRVIDGAQVRAELDAGDCIGLLRDAMIALSDGRARQPLRGILAIRN